MIFAHEFFHMAQWNVLLSAGQALSTGQGGTEQPIHYWRNTFIEAQAEFAVGVQYPELELGKSHVLAGSSAYGNSANQFLVDRLNTSYRELEANPISKYDLALYWRFLYEQTGDMAAVRVALEEMVRHLVMARHQRPDPVQGMAMVMDATFARLGGPFHSFEESLIAFARANYALRLENGRCAAADMADCGGRYYDPHEHYVSPPLEAKWAYGGSAASHSGAIPASYGMDFIELRLDPAARDRPLTIRFQGDGTSVRFSVQVWRLRSGEVKPLALTPRPEIVPHDGGGEATYTIPPQDTAAWDRLALIITRLDPDEAADPVGGYTITLDSAG